MKHFTKLNLPIFDTLLIELNQLLSSNTLNWGISNQICLNTIPSAPDNFELGTGSLLLDWENSKKEFNNKIKTVMVSEKKDILHETDFTILCDQFKGTIFETLYNMLSKNYILGRVRLMKLDPKTCLSWHVDDTPRLHYPILTQEGCFLVIEDEVMHLPLGKWYMADTTKKHTAFNGTKNSRIHLVAAILHVK
jgi:hypothetical protein